MWKLLTIVCLAAASQAKTLNDAAHLYGEYKTIYTWPKFEPDVPNCGGLVISKPDLPYTLDTCKCGRGSANLDVVKMEVNSKKFDILLDFVDDIEELRIAKTDKCSCTNSNLHHDVVWRIDDNYIVHYDTNIPRVYLMGKEVPTDEQFKKIVDGFYWKDKEGERLCV